MNGLNSLMGSIDQFQQGNNNNNAQYARFANANLNVVQIQPTDNFPNRNNGNMMLNNNGNGMNMLNMNNMGMNNMNKMNMNMNNMNMNMNSMNMGNMNNNNSKPSKRKAETYTCTVCQIEVTSQDVLQSHINGQKHAKKLRQIADNQQNNQPKSGTPDANKSIGETIKSEPGVPQAPTETSKSILQQINELASFHKLKVVYEVISETGPQHAKIFEIKCSLIDLKTNNCKESVTTSGSSHAKAKQSAAEIAIKNTKLEVPSKEQMTKKKNASKSEQQKQREEHKKQKLEKRNANQFKSPSSQTSSHPVKEKPPKSAQEIAFDEYELNNKFFIKNHLLAKHKQIQPSREQLDLISNLVTNIEKALKKISDKLVDEELAKVPKSDDNKPEDSGTEVKPDETKENHRHLKGVVRVGTIVKTLFLKSDRDIHLVVLTSKAPEYAFVKRISDELDNELVLLVKEQENMKASIATPTVDTSSTNEVEMKSSDEPASSEETPVEYTPPKIIYNLDKSESLIKREACINIECELPEGEFLAESNDNYRIKISFTSMSLLPSASQTEKDTVEQPTTDIALEKCMHALTEIRRVKWFNARLKPIANAILILRIMRDMCQRNPTWNVLSDWLLELTVEKCFVRNKYEDITMKLRAVFECIGSGILFMSALSMQCKSYLPHAKMPVVKSTDAEMKDVTEGKTETPKPVEVENPNTTIGFCDPCGESKSEANVFETNLTLQQREELTASAQTCLRQISFRKTHEVLAIDLIKMPAHPNKHKHHNGSFDNKFRRHNSSNNNTRVKGQQTGQSKDHESEIKTESRPVENKEMTVDAATPAV